METWQQWFDGKDFGSRTWMAGIARPYKLDQQYGFGLVSGATGTTYGKLVDANKHELVFEVDAGDGARLVIVGRCAITAAVEVETPNARAQGREHSERPAGATGYTAGTTEQE